MRNQVDLTPGRYSTSKTSGSNKFISTFSQSTQYEGIVEKRDSKYNWIGYKWAVGFTMVIGTITYLVIDYLMF